MMSVSVSGRTPRGRSRLLYRPIAIRVMHQLSFVALTKFVIPAMLASHVRV